MFTRLPHPIACFRRGQRLTGVLTLMVYVAMTMGLPVGYSGPMECNCACSTDVKSAGKCCCHLPRTDTSTKSCCATNSNSTKVPANELCGPSDHGVTAVCESQPADDLPACGRNKTSAQPRPSRPAADPDAKEPPMLSSCGCGGAAPSGILNSSEPRILFPKDCLVSGQAFAWSLSVSPQAPPEWNLPPETPPPEAV